MMACPFQRSVDARSKAQRSTDGSAADPVDPLKVARLRRNWQGFDWRRSEAWRLCSAWPDASASARSFNSVILLACHGLPGRTETNRAGGRDD
jgi:hypothetical protein